MWLSSLALPYHKLCDLAHILQNEEQMIIEATSVPFSQKARSWIYQGLIQLSHWSHLSHYGMLVSQWPIHGSFLVIHFLPATTYVT